MDNLHKLATERFKELNGVLAIADQAKREKTYEARQSVGRYTIEEAAIFTEIQTGENAAKICEMLVIAGAKNELVIYRPSNKTPFQDTMCSRPWSDEVYWDELNDWFEEKLSRIGRIFPEPVLSKSIGKNVSGKGAPDKPTYQVHKLRRNILDPAIEKAIKQAGNMELADVYLKLKELALAEENPFTGELDGDALCYTNDNNNRDKLTKNALGKRLKTRRKMPFAAVSRR